MQNYEITLKDKRVGFFFRRARFLFVNCACFSARQSHFSRRKPSETFRQSGLKAGTQAQACPRQGTGLPPGGHRSIRKGADLRSRQAPARTRTRGRKEMAICNPRKVFFGLRRTFCLHLFPVYSKNSYFCASQNERRYERTRKKTDHRPHKKRGSACHRLHRAYGRGTVRGKSHGDVGHEARKD